MTARAKDRATLAALIAFYLAVVVSQAALKLIWGDELFTFYIAKQPGLRGIWQALQAGADPNPPLMHVLVKASTSLFGDGSLGIRLPAILCVLLAIVSLWWMLRRWVRPAFAAAGVLAFMATRGFDYSYDARSYAPMMGFAMAALAFWMRASDSTGWRRTAAVAGMTLALALGISSNYYCVLAFFPVAAGELFRRFRMGVWLGMAVGSLPLFAYLPLIRHNIAEFGPHAWNQPHFSMVGFSYIELVEGIFWPVLALGIFSLWKRRDSLPLPRPEAAALAVLLIYPFLGFAIAIGGAGMISPRCVAPVCCGFGLAAGVLAQKVFGGMRRGAVGVVVLLVVWVVAREGICAGVLWQQRREFKTVVRDIADTKGQKLVTDSSLVLPLYFYSQEPERSAIVFPIDFDAIHRFEKDDSGEQNLWAGRDKVFPFLIVKLDDPRIRSLCGGSEVAGQLPRPSERFSCFPEFTVVARQDGWLASSLRDRRFVLTPVGGYSHWDLLGGVFTPMAHEDTRIFEVGQRIR